MKLLLITTATIVIATPVTATATTLSNETTTTVYAYSVSDKLKRSTPMGSPQPYLVINQTGERVKIRVPSRGNHRTMWVNRSSLGRYNVSHSHLRINRKLLRATLYKNGRKIWSAPVGIGAAGTPTPSGRFIITERLRGGGIYGAFAFGTSAYSVLTEWPRGGIIGIHGTNQPELLPGRVSHGCVRMYNHKIRQLRRLMPVGTSVRIV